MKYNYANIIGDAGEHLLAARIIKTFGYPCRLTNIDIGIDAEIEIIDNNYKSTGELIKCQIKTTTSNNFHLYLDGEHIKYWNSIHIPVVVFLVHLTTEKIFWHCIDNISTYPHTDSNYRIDFNPADKLSTRNKEKFRQISILPIKRQIENIYNDAYSIVISDNELLENGNYDLTSFEEFVYHANKIQFDLKNAAKLISRNKMLNNIETENNYQLSIVEEYLSRIEEETQSILEDHGSDFFDHLSSDKFDWD